MGNEYWKYDQEPLRFFKSSNDGHLRIECNSMEKAFLDLSSFNADNTHRDDPYYMLQYDLCEGCGEMKPIGMIPEIDHMSSGCPLNVRKVYGWGSLIGRDLIKMFCNLGNDTTFASLEALLDYPYLKKMPNYKIGSVLEKKIYLLQREMEIKQMKRMREYIELEKKLYWS